MESTKISGIGFCGLLAIVFITLKLCGVVTWSWAWILTPLWIGPAIIVAILGTIFVTVWIANYLDRRYH